MQKILREDAKKYAFNWHDKPLLRVQPGETFEIETRDASLGFFKNPEDKATLGQPYRRPCSCGRHRTRRPACRKAYDSVAPPVPLLLDEQTVIFLRIVVIVLFN